MNFASPFLKSRKFSWESKEKLLLVPLVKERSRRTHRRGSVDRPADQPQITIKNFVDFKLMEGKMAVADSVSSKYKDTVVKKTYLETETRVPYYVVKVRDDIKITDIIAKGKSCSHSLLLLLVRKSLRDSSCIKKRPCTF